MMDWHDDTAHQASTLIVERYRCRVWRMAAGTWTAVVSRQGGGTDAYSFATAEEAKAWCEAQVTDGTSRTGSATIGGLLTSVLLVV